MKIRKTNEDSLDELLTLCSSRLSTVFTAYINQVPALPLKNALAYTISNSGKLLRPLLVHATGAIFAAPLENIDVAACAVECIHSYSLIHDDLPCMDNADLRRGQPACHKVHGDGMAVLAGDALLTLAMQVLASHPAPLSSTKRIAMLKILSQAAGPFGMVAGQALDISLMKDKTITNDLLTEIYQLKTGALLSACIQLGHLSSDDDDINNKNALYQFGNCIGIAFQIQDDILDIETNTILLGKTRGLDEKNNKITYPKVAGMENAKQKVTSLYEQALESIHYMGHEATLLRKLAGQMLRRIN